MCQSRIRSHPSIFLIRSCTLIDFCDCLTESSWISSCQNGDYFEHCLRQRCFLDSDRFPVTLELSTHSRQRKLYINIPTTRRRKGDDSGIVKVQCCFSSHTFHQVIDDEIFRTECFWNSCCEFRRSAKVKITCDSIDVLQCINIKE